MYCSCAELYVLFFHVLWLHIVSSDSSTPVPYLCGGEYRNVDAGEIFPPANISDLPNEVCTWILSAAPGKKLLVKLDHVLVPNSNQAILTLYVDGEEINIPRVCKHCQSNIVGGMLKVALELMPRNFSDGSAEENMTGIVNFNESDVSFLITYKSFDPHSCGVPASPSNGYFVDKGRSVGSKIRYYCSPPYELTGSSKSTCITTQESPIPVWENKPPQCVVPPCNGRVLSRTAGKGMIVHPGYPAKTVLSGQHCEWHVRTDGSKQVVANIKFFSLPLGEKKRKNGGTYLDLYDASHDNVMLRLRGQETPRSVTTTSNHLIVVLQTDNLTRMGNDASDTFGFYIEYSSTCEALTTPLNGSMYSSSLTIGSNASFQCNEGFVMEGSANLVCLLDANWSSSPPRCHFPTSSEASISVANNTIVAVGHIPLPSSDYDDDDDYSDGPSTSTTSFSAMTNEVDTSPAVFSVMNDSFAAEHTTTLSTDTSPIHENGHFNGKGNRKSDMPSHQDANAKSYITKVNKEEETRKSLSSNGQSNDLHQTQQHEKHREESVALSDFMVILIASAISVSVALGLVLLGVCLWYRKQYPVRMNFGRKFETFENPIYQTRGKKTGASSPTVPEDPAELQRLTAARLSL